MPPHPASSRQLSEFAVDVQLHLEETELFRKISVKNTGETQCALLFSCHLADPSMKIKKIAEILERLWNEAPLGFFGANNSFKTTAINNIIQAHFATSDGDITITGCIEVTKFKEHSKCV